MFRVDNFITDTQVQLDGIPNGAHISRFIKSNYICIFCMHFCKDIRACDFHYVNKI